MHEFSLTKQLNVATFLLLKNVFSKVQYHPLCLEVSNFKK